MTGSNRRKIEIAFLWIVMVCLCSSITAQNPPEYSSTIESKEDLVKFKIQALPQSATRYHFSETDRKTTSGSVFMDIQIEDDFSLTPVSFSEGVIGVKFRQGREMWKRIFIVEEGLPEKWNELIWPELLLSIDAESGKIILMNGSEVRPFIEARLEELDHKMNTVESQKKLSFMMDHLRTMVKDNESLCFWLTQPLQFMGHGTVIEVPQGQAAVVTEVIIQKEISDTLQRSYRLTRTEEDGNNVRYSREGQNTLTLWGHQTAKSNLIPTPITNALEEWVFDDQHQLIEVARQSSTTSKSAMNPLTIERSMRIIRLDD